MHLTARCKRQRTMVRLKRYGNSRILASRCPLSIGDRESPCRTPLLCRIAGPWWPLSMILDDAVLSRTEIHRRQFCPNPLACSTFSRNGHESVSTSLWYLYIYLGVGCILWVPTVTNFWEHCKNMYLSLLPRYLAPHEQSSHGLPHPDKW